MPAGSFNPQNYYNSQLAKVKQQMAAWDFSGAVNTANVTNQNLSPWGMSVPSDLIDQNAYLQKLSPQEVKQYQTVQEANNILSVGNNGNSGLKISASDIIKNPDLTAQQLANKKVIDYWSNESEAFSRVINAANTSPEKLKVINTENGLALTTGEHPGYDTLYLNPTNQPNVYNFSTYNQVAGGNIHGVIGVNPDTGAVSPVVDAAKQFAYTPGSSGSFLGGLIGSLGDIFKDLGPIGVVLGNLVTPGLGTALGVITAIDEGADLEDIAKNIAIGEIVNQVGVGSEITDSTVAADLVDNTLKGLLSGQDLDQALTNSVVSSVAAEVSNQTPDDFQADVEDVLDSTASTPVSDYVADVNNVLDLPATPEPVSGQDLSADLLGNTLEDITAALSGEGEFISGQDLSGDLSPGNTIADVAEVLPPLDEPQLPPAPAEPGLTKAQVEALIKTALAATAADQVVNQPEPQKTGFDLVPVPTDWKSPVYDQSFTPVDLNSIFQNLQGMQTQWKPRPSITGGAYMGSPVNISDIVNNIMSAELTPQAMPTNITNAVGGILGSSTTR